MKNTVEVMGVDATGKNPRKLRISYYGENNLYHVSIWNSEGELLGSVVLPKEILFSSFKLLKDGDNSRPGFKR